MTLVARLAALGTATVGEAASLARIVDLPLRPLAPGMVIEVFGHWSNREVPDDGQRREPVFLFAYGIPARP